MEKIVNWIIIHTQNKLLKFFISYLACLMKKGEPYNCFLVSILILETRRVLKYPLRQVLVQ